MFKEEPLVSIIIPTYNSERTLRKCLESIVNQIYRNIEIIVVDGGSGDNTVKVAQEMRSKVYCEKGLSMSAATNFGIRMCKGKYVYRVDSDVILNSNLVKEAVEKCENEGYDGICVFWLPCDSISFWAKVRKLEKKCYIKHPDYVGNIKYGKKVLGARFLKREIFDAIGGMDEKVPSLGEDYAFYDKLSNTSYHFTTINALEEHLGEPVTIQEIIKKNIFYGKTSVTYFKNSKAKRLAQLLPLRIPLIKEWKEFLKQPSLTLGFMLYQLVVYMAEIIGFMVYRLGGKK